MNERKRFLEVFFSKSVVSNSIKISIFVGTILNMINQGEKFINGHPISWVHFFLNYLVPYLVASYSASKNLINQK